MQSGHTNFSNNGIDTWIGNYVFNEFAAPNIDMNYSISIYKENGDYYANIKIDGFQSMTRAKAKIKGNDNSIVLIFDEYLPDNKFKLFNKDDILLTFKKKNSDIVTYWGKLKPILTENKDSGKVYFKRTKGTV